MLSQIFQNRLQVLLNHITEDQELLKEFEEELRYETNPRVIRGYKREVQRQKDSIVNYRQEYIELEQQLGEKSEPQIQEVDNKLQLVERQWQQMHLLVSQLQQIDEKLNIVLGNQKLIYQDITAQLNQNQLLFTQKMLDAVAANQVSDLQMQQMLAVLLELGTGFNLKSAWEQVITKLRRQ